MLLLGEVSQRELPAESQTRSQISQICEKARNLAHAMDGNLSTFWVSSGTSPGQGPTTNNPEWLQFTFPRIVAVSEFQIAPRTLNGGYGPKTIEMFLDGALVYAGTMINATLDVRLPEPAYATNAQLLITSSYDPGYPTKRSGGRGVVL